MCLKTFSKIPFGFSFDLLVVQEWVNFHVFVNFLLFFLLFYLWFLLVVMGKDTRYNLNSS